MPLIIATLILQVSLIVHCVRTGRNTFWIWVIAFLPAVGAFAYLFAELLPELMSGRRAQRAVRKIRSSIDPQRSLREAELASRGATDVASRQRYAEELSRQGRHSEAISIYQLLLSGLYENDPNLMLELARAQFAMSDFSATRATLDRLIQSNPEFRSPDGHFLYARALEELNEWDLAIQEYAELTPGFPGAEPKLRYARLLRRVGREVEAAQVFRDILEQAERAPAHYRRSQKEWLDAAAREAR